MSPSELGVAVFLALAAVVVAARLFGWVGRRFLGQPRVVGEMIAGIALGPSVLGLVAPDMQAALFPGEIADVLYVVAHLGIALYMFIVGLEFDRAQFRRQARSAGAVSAAGLTGPFVAAVLLAPWLMDLGLFASEMGTTRTILFLGACMSITAFPVLARILHERGLAHTPLCSLALSAGAINDAAAWIVLALMMAASPMSQTAPMDQTGMYAVFGGFLIGVAFPRGPLAKTLRDKLGPVTGLVLVPVFFTWSGLFTELGLVTDPALLGVAGMFLAVSIASKFGACWAAARLAGQSNPTALGLGALMNARGLIELIVASVGLQSGMIGPEMFTVLVLMTLATTLMTVPLFERVYGRQARERGDLGTLDETAPGAASPAAV